MLDAGVWWDCEPTNADCPQCGDTLCSEATEDETCTRYHCHGCDYTV